MLQANDAENIMTRFPVKKTKQILKACVYFFILPWKRHIRKFNYQTTKVSSINLRVAMFGNQRIKGFREKGEWSTGIKNCVGPS